jgi:hypothetical protein
MSPISRAARATAPIAIPAIAPLDSPVDALEVAAVGVGDDDEEDEDVADGVGTVVGNVMNAVTVGSTTPAHLCSAPEL